MANGLVIDETVRSKDERDPSSILGPTLEPFTRSFFNEAGLKSGMRVLDLCSGVGDVAFLVQEIVGNDGLVVGFDNQPSLVGYATDRAAYRNLSNVEFIEGNFESVSFPNKFDAIVGRLVLMDRKDPAADLRAVVHFVRPGGLVMLQELDLLAAATVPVSPEIERVRQWIHDICNVAGIDPQMGPKLHPTLLAAGLTDIQMRIDGLMGGDSSLLPALLCEVAATLAPLHPMGSAKDTEAQSHTAEERMRADLAKSGGVMSTALLISAWAKVPC